MQEDHSRYPLCGRDETVYPLRMTSRMSKLLSCYYLDIPLDEEELAFLRGTLIGPWARFKTGATALVQKRVPAVLPVPDVEGGRASREQRAQQMCANLRHAGIRADAGRQVVWVAPRDAEWDAIFQCAIRMETGAGPYVAQRRYANDGSRISGGIRVIDTDMLLRKL